MAAQLRSLWTCNRIIRPSRSSRVRHRSHTTPQTATVAPTPTKKADTTRIISSVVTQSRRIAATRTAVRPPERLRWPGGQYPFRVSGGHLGGVSCLLKRRQLRGLLAAHPLGVQLLAHPAVLLSQRGFGPLGKFEAGSCDGSLGGPGLRPGGHPFQDVGHTVRRDGRIRGLLADVSDDAPPVPECLQGVYRDQPLFCPKSQAKLPSSGLWPAFLRVLAYQDRPPLLYEGGKGQIFPTSVSPNGVLPDKNTLYERSAAARVSVVSALLWRYAPGSADLRYGSGRASPAPPSPPPESA